MRLYTEATNDDGARVFRITLDNKSTHEITEQINDDCEGRSYPGFSIDYWRDDDASPYRYANGIRSRMMAEAIVELQIARLEKIGNVYEQVESAFRDVLGHDDTDHGDLEDMLTSGVADIKHLKLVFNMFFKFYIPIDNGWVLLIKREPKLFAEPRCPWEVACAVALLADKYFVEKANE